MILAFGILLGVCAVYEIPSSTGPVHYSRFTGRTPDYYSNLVDACELLLQTAPAGIEYGHTFAGTNVSLPRITWELRPSRVEILSRGELVDETRLLTFVRIYMGESRGGYSIIWAPTLDGSSLWRLGAAQEGRDSVLLTMKKKSGMKTPTPPPGGDQ
jgi:hypothetical protein